MNKYKAGDRLKCVSDGTRNTGGAGFKVGKEVTVDHTTADNRRQIVWPTGGGSGVYSDHLELMACTKCNHSPEYCNCGGS